MFGRRGFAPRPPERVQVQEICYRDDPAVAQAVENLHDRTSQVFQGRWPADPSYTELILIKVKRILTERKFSESFIDRVWLCLAEGGANSMIYGEPNSTVSFALTIMGRAPHRICLVLLDNYLRPSERCRFPQPDRLPAWEKILTKVHGRGTRLIRDQANSFHRLVIPGFLVMNVIHFLEDDGREDAPR